jgi:hypothetical protein
MATKETDIRYEVRALGHAAWSETPDARQALEDWREARDRGLPVRIFRIVGDVIEDVTGELG